MYGTPGSVTYVAKHANINNSTVLNNLQTWYASKLSGYSNILEDSIWCNDMRIDTIYPYGTTLGFGANQTGYSARGRLYADQVNLSPTFICQNDSSGGKLSKYTADETTYGNGALVYKIGLLTIDEAAYAGGIQYKSDGSSNNITSYLYKNASGAWWWTLSPDYFNGSSAVVRCVSSSVALGAGIVHDIPGLRPSISLVSTVIVTGVGTSANPYVVSV